MTDAREWISLLAVNVAHYRAQAGLTLDEVATVAGVTLGYIHNIENRRANPTLATIIGIANALDIEPAQLLLPRHKPAEFLTCTTNRTSDL